MIEGFKSMAPARFGAALALCSAVLLAGCQMSNPEFDNDPTANAFYERYPIHVKNAPVQMGVVAHNGMLNAEQANAVANFGRDASSNRESRVVIRYPSGGHGAREAALEISQMLADEGIPSGQIQPVSYPGGAGSPIQLTFQRKVAVTRECGDWSDNIANSPQNLSYRNFGCAYQQNLAAMVANPGDFERPRTMTPVVGANRVAAMQVYYDAGEAAKQTATTTAAVAAQPPSTSN